LWPGRGDCCWAQGGIVFAAVRSRMMLFPMQMGEGLPLPGRALLFDVEK